MLKVTLEIVPFGDERLKRRLGVLEIANDGSGTALSGSYDLRLDGVTMKRLEAFDRTRGAWALVHEATRLITKGEK